MGEHTGLPWKLTNAVKASNFGSVAARVTGMAPDPAKPGEMTSVTIAKVFGGLHDDRAVAESHAALIVKACNAHDALVKALEAAVAEMTDAARIICQEYDRKTRSYVFNDVLWKAKLPGSFSAIVKARKALAQVRP